ncbi:D-cysteine desulfhydrase family protein [Microbulbifer agarilyticus]
MLDRFDRVELIHWPTPLNKLNQLSAKYGLPLWVKRDDLNGVGAGGNKVRKLEYLLAEARNNHHQSVVTGGGLQSNHAAATAICAKRLGMKTHLALAESVPIQSAQYTDGANLVLDTLCSAEITRFPAGSVVNECVSAVTDEVAQRTGERPYEVCMGGSSALGALGYVRGALELAEQFKALGTAPDSLIHGSGSAGTQAGLIVGFALAGIHIRVLAASVLHERNTLFGMVLSLCEEMGQMLDMGEVRWSDHIHIDDTFIGEGYGLPNKATWKAIETALTSESIVLDPCYTGKAFAYFLSLLEKSPAQLGASSMYLHTGGMGGLFAYGEQMPTPA